MRRPRAIAPRLATGEKREHQSHGLPPWIKDALREAARVDNVSVSWIEEQIVVEWLEATGRRFRRPRYLPRKKKEAR
jgi:hypothetical protein